MGFQETVFDRLSRELIFSYMIRLSESLFHIPKCQMLRCTDVVLNMIMKLWRPFFHCLKGIKHGWKLFIVHFDEIQGFFCNVFVDCRNSSHLVSNIPDRILGQWGLVTSDCSKSIFQTPWKISACNDSSDSWEFQHLACINIQNLCMGYC